MIVTRLDPLARSTRDLLNVLDEIGKRGAGFRSLNQARRGLPFAQGHLGRHYDPHGRLMLTVLGGLAEFERELIRWPPLFSGSPDYATIPLTTMAKSGPFTTER